MRSYNMHEAKTHLSRLVREAVAGEPFIIARSGRPLVKVVAMESEEKGVAGRVGFLAGRISVPRDFDRMGESEIDKLFEGDR